MHMVLIITLFDPHDCWFSVSHGMSKSNTVGPSLVQPQWDHECVYLTTFCRRGAEACGVLQ